MAEFEVIPSTVRYTLFDPVRFILLKSNEAVYHCVSQVATMNPAAVAVEQLASLTTEQAALIAIGILGLPWICNKCLDGYLRKHRYFRCLWWLQKLKILEYREETISIPARLQQNDTNPHNFVTIQPVLTNFPDPGSVTVYYATESQQKLGPYDVSMSHLLLAGSNELGRVTALARDPYGYEAQCSFDVIKGIDNKKGEDVVDYPILLVKDQNQNANRLATSTLVNPTPATPTLVTPTLVTPTLATPTLVTPTLVTPTMATPEMINPLPVMPASANPTPATPTLVTPTLVTPTLATHTLVTPTLVTPTMATPEMVTPLLVMPASATLTQANSTKTSNTGAAKIMISKVVGASRKLDLLIEDYEQLASDLLAWIKKTRPWLEDRTLPENTLPQIQNKLGEFRVYRCKERLVKVEEKCKLEADFNTLQTKLRLRKQPAYMPSEGKLLSDINKAWKDLERAECGFEDWLMTELKRLERLDHLAKKFKHKCDIHEGWSDGKDEQLKDNDFSNTKLNELRAMQIKHEAVESQLDKHQAGVKEISAIAQEMKDLKYHDIAAINEQCQRICDQWDLLGTLETQRRVALDDNVKILQKIDDFHNEFATRVAPYNTEMDKDRERLQDQFLVHTVEEVQDVMKKHLQFKETIGEVTKEYSEIVQIVTEVKEIGQQYGHESALENPYTSLQVDDVADKWSELQRLVPERDSALEHELVKQQSQENLRQQFAQQANTVGSWIEKQQNAVEDQQGTGNLRQYEQMVVAYKPHMDELEACNQAVQEAMIFENPHTDYTMEKIHDSWDPLLPTIRIKINRIENQTFKLRRASQSISEDQLTEFRTSFNHFDKKHNETLDPEQFRACLISLGYEVQADEKGDQEFQDIMAEVDPNNASQITFPNFLHYMTWEAANSADNYRQVSNSFKVLAGNKPYITEGDLRRKLSQDQAEYCIAHMKPYTDGPSGALDYVNFSKALYEKTES